MMISTTIGFGLFLWKERRGSGAFVVAWIYSSLICFPCSSDVASSSPLLVSFPSFNEPPLHRLSNVVQWSTSQTSLSSHSLHPLFLHHPSLPHSLPSIRSGLSAGISHFPAAAWGEASHTSNSALWEENGHATAWEQRQSHTKTGLPTCLQHT